MRHQRKSSISLAILILCLGSLVLLPFDQVRGFETEIYGIDVDGCEPFEDAETEDDFLVSVSFAVFAGLILSKFRRMNLDIQSSFISPLFPPPKYT